MRKANKINSVCQCSLMDIPSDCFQEARSHNTKTLGYEVEGPKQDRKQPNVKDTVNKTNKANIISLLSDKTAHCTFYYYDVKFRLFLLC